MSYVDVLDSQFAVGSLHICLTMDNGIDQTKIAISIHQDIWSADVLPRKVSEPDPGALKFEADGIGGSIYSWGGHSHNPSSAVRLL